MSRSWKPYWFVWLILGLGIGLTVSGLWPNTPLHATATDRFEKFAVATGSVDDEREAVYFLDFYTGELRAAVIGTFGWKFNSFFRANVLGDLNALMMQERGGDGGDAAGGPLVTGRDTRYLLVTGRADLKARGAAQTRPGAAIVYVIEVESGWLLAYAIPWNRTIAQRGAPQTGDLQLLHAQRLRPADPR
ncbi:MAG: hypothetical protein HQ581_11495 [Planctomycetes bacterium]|nr:hypothetical protein [Planctomycetota bacterium]